MLRRLRFCRVDLVRCLHRGRPCSAPSCRRRQGRMPPGRTLVRRCTTATMLLWPRWTRQARRRGRAGVVPVAFSPSQDACGSSGGIDRQDGQERGVAGMVVVAGTWRTGIRKGTVVVGVSSSPLAVQLLPSPEARGSSGGVDRQDGQERGVAGTVPGCGDVAT